MSLGMAIMNQIGYQMTRQALTLMMRCITFFKLLGRLSYDQIDSTISSCAFTVLFNLYGGNLHWLSGSIRASLDQELLNSYIYLLNKIDVIRFIIRAAPLPCMRGNEHQAGGYNWAKKEAQLYCS